MAQANRDQNRITTLLAVTNDADEAPIRLYADVTTHRLLVDVGTITVTGAGTSMTDDSAFTVGTTLFTPAGGTYRSVRDAVDDNDGGAFAMTQTRALYVSLETPLGDSVLDDTLNTVKVSQATAANLNMTEANSTAIAASVALIDEIVDDTNDVARIVQKKIAASTYAPTRFVDLGANATANVKGSAGNVFSLYCNNENTADRYVQLHNTATTPAGGATPLYTFRVPGLGDVLIGTDFFTNEGGHFTTGIAFGFSSTKDTYTAGTASEQSTEIHYV